MLRMMPQKGLLTTCLTLLLLAWAIFFSTLAARAQEAPLVHLTCQTKEFSPNVDLEIHRQSSQLILHAIVTSAVDSSTVTYAQTNISNQEAKNLIENHTGVFKLVDPVSGTQLLALQNGNGGLSLNAKGQDGVIDLKNCR